MGAPDATCLALALVASACGGAHHDSAIGNQAGAGKQHDLTAAYLCSITDSGYRYPNFPCAIRQVGDRYVLAKLAGSQRFRGEVRPVGEGFSFDGEYFCPFGDCNAPMHGEFVRRPNGELVGHFTDTQVMVTLQPAPANAGWAGGSSYGGDAYGGFGYGGAAYGGGPMLMPEPHNRGNRRP